MARYEYRCSGCSDFEVPFPIGQAPAALECPGCGATSPRRLSVPWLSAGSTAARRLVESTSRSAEQPDVVSSVPPGGRRAAPRSATNPLHHLLPRP